MRVGFQTFGAKPTVTKMLEAVWNIQADLFRLSGLKLEREIHKLPLTQWGIIAVFDMPRFKNCREVHKIQPSHRTSELRRRREFSQAAPYQSG